MKYGDAEHKTLIGMAGGLNIKGCRTCGRFHRNYYSITHGGKERKMNSANLRSHLASAHDVYLADNHTPRRWWQFWRW